MEWFYFIIKQNKLNEKNIFLTKYRPVSYANKLPRSVYRNYLLVDKFEAI